MKRNYKTLCFNKTGVVRFMLICMAVLALSNFIYAQKDNKGKEFWIAIPGQLKYQYDPELYLTGDVATSGVVSIPGRSFSVPFTITPGTITTVKLSTVDQVNTQDVVSNHGIHITSQEEITVYAMNQAPNTTDAYLALPVDVLSKEYINMSYPGINVNSPSQLTVVATEDGTTLTVTLTETIGGKTAGVPYNITLNEGEVYQIQANNANAADLTGSIVESDKPVAVIGSTRCSNVPPNEVACDYLVEQIPGTNTWGKTFYSLPLKTRLNGDTFRFLASEDGTTVSLNGSVIANLNRGEFYETIINTKAMITSNHPILVAQFSNGTSFDNQTGDPFMMLIPPFEQYLGSYTISTPSTAFPTNLLNLIVSAAGINNVAVDGTLVPSSDFQQIAGSSFYGASVEVSVGSHTINSVYPVGVHSYGFAYADSYGYLAGQSFSEVAVVTSLVLSPKTASKNVGEQHCVTATILDSDSNSVVGVRVDFETTGANITSGFAFTDSNGVAQYCYVGANSGLDSILASSGALNDNGIVTWNGVGCNLSLDATITDPTCNGDKNGKIDLMVMGGTSPYTYSWNTGATTEDIDNLGAGVYTVKVVDANGCTDSAKFILQNPPAINYGTKIFDLKCKGGNNGIACIFLWGGVQPYTYQWDNGDSLGCAMNLTAGTYCVKARDNNGCEINECLTIEDPARVCDRLTLGTGDESRSAKFEISPSRFNRQTKVNIALPQDDYVSLKIYDLSGNMVANLFEGKVIGYKEYNFQFVADGLGSGLYIGKLQTGTHIYTEKMVLVK